MDPDTLVSPPFDEGQKLIEELSQRGFPVTAAFWIKASENGKWYFYIVSPAVDDEGLAQAYRRLHPLVWALPQRFRIDPLAIKLIGPANPIAQDVLAIHARGSGPRGGRIRWGGKRVGHVSIEDAYLYPLPATTPS
jgi:hypothetical protein